MKKIIFVALVWFLFSGQVYADDWYENEESASNDYIEEVARSVMPLRQVSNMIVAAVTVVSTGALPERPGHGQGRPSGMTGSDLDVVDKAVLNRIMGKGFMKSFGENGSGRNGEVHAPVGSTGSRAHGDRANNKSRFAGDGLSWNGKEQDGLRTYNNFKGDTGLKDISMIERELVGQIDHGMKKGDILAMQDPRGFVAMDQGFTGVRGENVSNSITDQIRGQGSKSELTRTIAAIGTRGRGQN